MRPTSVSQRFVSTAALIMALCLYPSVGYSKKYCSASGRYYCALGAADPATSRICGTTPQDAIIEGVNYSAGGFFDRGGDWSPPTGWFFAYSRSDPKDRIYNVTERQIFYNKRHNPDSYPDTISLHAQVRVYDCNECVAPFTWDTETNSCTTTCPAGTQRFDSNLGLCLLPNDKAPKQPDTCAGNPIDVRTGEKIQYFEADLRVGGGLFPIEFKRHYRSLPNPVDRQQTLFARSLDRSGWRKYYQPDDYSGPSFSLLPASGIKRPDVRNMSHNFEVRIYPVDDLRVYYKGLGGSAQLIASREGSSPTPFDEGVMKKLPTGWEVRKTDGLRETFGADGRLVRIDHPSGEWQSLSYDEHGNLVRVREDSGYQIEFAYDSNNLLKEIQLPDGNKIEYSHDDIGRLHRVAFPDATHETYLYEDPHDPHLLTAIVDGKGIRYAEWKYDDTGRGIYSAHAGGVERTEIEYQGLLQTVVTNPFGHKKTIEFEAQRGRIRSVTGGSCASGTGGAHGKRLYSFGNPVTITNEKGVVTKLNYTRDGRLNYREVAHGTSLEHRTYFGWDRNSGRLRTVNDSSDGYRHYISFDYDSEGRLTKRTETGGRVSRVTTFEYHDSGLLAKIDGPRQEVEDTTHFFYDNRRRLSHIVNGLGQTVFEALAFDESGRLSRFRNAHGTIVEQSYDARGRLLLQSIAGETTRFHYDGVGQLVAVAFNDRTKLSFQYDDARRLVEIKNSLSERIEFQRDAIGNATSVKFIDATGNIVKKQAMEFDELGRLIKEIRSDESAIEFEYDAASNIVLVRNPLAREVIREYDLLDRVSSVTDANGQKTIFTYDVADNLTSVTDARGLKTRYQYNPFGELTAIHSPDTGTTEFKYDKAGNRIERKDARGVVTHYDYDALNRLVSIRYPDNPEENILYSYDSESQGNRGLGRLTSVRDRSGSTSFRYDAVGRLIEETRVVESAEYVTRYEHNDAGRVSQMHYPSGRVVRYNYDSAGQVTTVTTAESPSGVFEPVVSDVAYLPFGPVRQLRFGNGITRRMSFDQDYQLTELNSDLMALQYRYDATDNITEIRDLITPESSQTFEYDLVSRLVSASGSYGTIDYAYDPVGNRQTRRFIGSDRDTQETYLYAMDSNRLLSVSTTEGGASTERRLLYSEAGNLVADMTEYRQLEFIYNQANRLEALRSEGETLALYLHNALGQRVAKVAQTPEQDAHYIYDTEGRLIAEHSSTGSVIREFVYLNDIPVAVIQATPGTARQ